MTTAKFTSKTIKEATKEDLRFYAQAFLGIPTKDLNDAEVLAKIKAASDTDTIYVAVPDAVPHFQSGQIPTPVEEPAQGSGLVGSLGHADPKVTLTLHAEERDGVVINRHKEVGVNGVVWLLKRGEPITIPYRVYEALQNAQRHVITHDSEGTVVEQVTQSTPFNIIKMPSDAEVAAWHAKTDQVFVP